MYGTRLYSLLSWDAGFCQEVYCSDAVINIVVYLVLVQRDMQLQMRVC